LIAPSPLSMVLTGVLLLVAILSFLSFYADRFRLPLSMALLALMACATYVSGVDHQFWSERLRPGSLSEAVTPREVIELSPGKLIVVAAAGGGIHASGWTAQVLAGLREGAQGQAFKRALRVISGVSGGAVGAVFYAGTYDGVWSDKAYSLQEARSRAMASSLGAVSWGLVYPDMHRLLLPIPRWLWRDEDRGTSLERSIALTAGGSPGPRLLSLAPLVRDGFPVLLLNATLSADALPVTFTNSRYPDPSATEAVVRIGSFHEDFQRDTRLETAARLSATFPIVSPAARPGEYAGHNTFVDGGYFDNSGLYALMAWLTQAAPPVNSGAQRREVLLLMIEPFPEPASGLPTAAKVSWYRQFTIPLETAWGVHATGQAVRNRYELPLLKKFLDDRFKVHELQFRYASSDGCKDPPLSWHLTLAEKKCIAEAWNQPKMLEARRQVVEWLKDVH
jgi:predicted acylesterase/phospholipase RssA